MNEYDISEAFRRIENDLIDSLIRNLERHRAQESKEGYDWDAWQTVQLRELEKYRFQNRHRFDDDFEEINKAIRDLCIEHFKNGDSGEWLNLSDALNQDYSKPSSALGGLNAKRLDALVDATQQDFEKAEHAILRKANDEYRKIIFDAQVYANQGGTYEEAVDMATKDFLKNGIKSIVYSNGARHQISDYAKMALRTGGKRAYLMGLGQQMARLGIHTIRVNRRDGACPFCTPWLGRVLIDDVYNEGTEEEARKKGYPLLSEAIDKGFLHPNCKDVYSMYIEGVSKPEEPYTDKEKDKLQQIYDLEQEINKAEGIRESYRRMSENSIDPKDASRYSTLYFNWKHKAEELRKQLAELKKGMPSEGLTSVPPVNHEGIRSPIEIEKDEVTKGVFEIPDGAITFGETEEIDDTDWRGNPYHYSRTPIMANKQISLPWEGFGRQGQSYLRWNLPDYRYDKPFLIQKKDLENALMYLDERKNYSAVEWYKKNGYKYLGRINIHKYNEPFRLQIGEKDGKRYIIIDDTMEEDFTIKQSTIDSILEREKIVSKKLWDEGVRFRDLTARRGEEFNEAMTKFHTVVEADRPVSLVTREVYDEIEGTELYRGIAPVSHLRTDLKMVKTPRECAVQLMEGGVGDCFPSRGVYGDGIAYTSNSTRTAQNYASGFGGSDGGVIVRLKLKKDARIIEYDDAVKLFEQIADAHPNDGSPYFNRNQVGSRHEVGKAMQILGYDIIYEPRGDGMNVHFYIVLNRDAIVGVADDYIERTL